MFIPLMEMDTVGFPVLVDFHSLVSRGVGRRAECLPSCHLITDKAEGCFEVLPLSLPDSHSLFDTKPSSSARQMLR